MKAFGLLVFAFVTMITPMLAQETPAAPVATRKPKTTAIHGETLTDPWYWLREKSNPEVIAYLEAENAWTNEVMAPAAELRESIYNELVGRIKQTDLSVPYRYRGYLYFTRTEEGKQYPQYWRRKAADGAPDELMLDQNELAAGEKFLSIGDFEVSDDGTLLAYSVDNTGFRQHTLRVKDLRTGGTYADTIEKCDGVVWAADSRTLFYIVEDHAKRPYRLYRHVLGQKDDELLYEEKDEIFELYLERSRSGDYVLLMSASKDTTELRYIPAATPGAAPVVVIPRRTGHEYYVDHRGDLFYIRTNDGAKNFRLVTAPIADPRQTNWKELVAGNSRVMLSDVSLFADYAVLSERSDGNPRFAILDLATGKISRPGFPEPIYSARLDKNPEFAAPVIRYRYESFVTPMSVFEYDVATKTSRLLKETAVLGGYDRTRYASERVYAVASDGTKIPVSLLYRKGLVKNGKNPTLLYGYGSYGIPQFVGFKTNVFSLVDRGFVFAIAHIRGGGELGQQWYDDGKLMKKRNTFTDFISAAEYLIRRKYTAPGHLAIQGGSAGGLLVGAVVNMRPDLFKAVVANVPFVDVINSMLDASLPLTVPEYIEWGNPNEKDEYAYMRTYCPYSNIRAQKYPDMLVTTSLNDSQVMYWEAAKYVAKLRATRSGDNPLLLKVNMAAGHGGSSGRYDRLREVAFEYAFLLRQLGVE